MQVNICEGDEANLKIYAVIFN